MARSKTPGLTQRGGSVWNYDIVVDAVRYQGSTKTTDLKTATLFLSQLRLDIARGKLALKDTRRTLLLEEVHREFLASKTPSASPRYITSATAHWRVWIAPRLGKTPVDRIDAAMVDQLRNDLLVAGRSPVFTNNVLISLRTLLNFAVKRGRLRRALKVELLRVQRKPRPTLMKGTIDVVYRWDAAQRKYLLLSSPLSERQLRCFMRIEDEALFRRAFRKELQTLAGKGTPIQKKLARYFLRVR